MKVTFKEYIEDFIVEVNKQEIHLLGVDNGEQEINPLGLTLKQIIKQTTLTNAVTLWFYDTNTKSEIYIMIACHNTLTYKNTPSEAVYICKTKSQYFKKAYELIINKYKTAEWDHNV